MKKRKQKRLLEINCPIQCKSCPSDEHYCFIKLAIRRLKKLRKEDKNLIVIDEMLKILETPDKKRD